MVQERLNGLALLNMHRNINLNVENAIDRNAEKRRGGGIGFCSVSKFILLYFRSKIRFLSDINFIFVITCKTTSNSQLSS